MSYKLLGYGYAWWSSDPFPQLSPRVDLRVTSTDDAALVADLARLNPEEIVSRMEQGNQAYVGYVRDQPIAYGWSAAKIGAIYELDLVFEIPPGNRYLWDFATLPEWRGCGVYPRLLQAIIEQEQPAAQRFWIGHTADNHASRQGILKAGFQTIEALVRTESRQLKILPLDGSPRAALSPMGLRLGVLTPDADDAG
ncbi:MAG TPA: GNAT family N-acetyltransferase [Herpetosiphonaceae bacterium]